MAVHARRLRALPLALLTLAIAGCGTATETPAGPPPTARYAIPSDTASPAAVSSASPTASPGTTSDTTSDTNGAASTQAFVEGMAAYCTSYYSGLSEAEESFPHTDQAADVAYSRAATDAAETAEALLKGLDPPAKLAKPFARFVALGHEITRARERMTAALTTTGTEGPARDDYDRAVLARRPLAEALGAPICDGKLSSFQEAAVVRTVRAVEAGPDSQVVCRDLVTPGFLAYDWASYPDPVAACALTRDALAAQRPRGIMVDEVIGADGISATVSYREVGGCGCGSHAVAKVHLVDGVWRVASISY